MQHFGDIKTLNGYDLPAVDVITGGSPCQDLSIAGNRAGLDGERSGLFLEQIRIVREMREADEQRGRTGMFIRPRFMVWENVCGAFSSNGGRDFQTVLTECVRIAEPDAPDVPYPEKGKWTKAGTLMGDGWSVAWRTLDAQYWGVPQRRRRIALVCDFGGQSAGEILFNADSVSGHFTQGGTPEKGTAGAVETCAYPSIARSLTARMDGSPCVDRGPEIIVQNAVKCLNPWDSQSGRVYDADGVFHSLVSCENAGMQRDAVLAPTPINTMVATRHKSLGRGTGFGVGEPGDPAFTVSAAHSHAVFDARGNGDGKTVNTITGDHESRVTDYTALVMSVHQNQNGEARLGEVANTLSTNGNASGRNAPLIAIGLDSEHNAYEEQYGTLRAHMSGGAETAVAVNCRDATESEINGTLQAKETGYSLNTNITVRQYGVVRRLTPLEAERLQGYPSGYTDIGDWTDDNGKTHKTSDSARYRALGNSIALPPWKWVLKRISAQYERDATLGSLFDGLGGFPLLWEQFNGKGSAVWASEIEPFCIAVSKKRIG